MSEKTTEQAREWSYQLVRDHWDEILGTLRHIVTQFADEVVEVAARAVMLLAPLPNAISVYNITQSTMGFSGFQAFAFSMTIELVIFFLIEIALLMLTRWLQGKLVYQWAFYGMSIVVLGGTGIIINLVYSLEVHKVMAWLPVISLCGFIAVGLKRWDARNMEIGVKGVKPSVKGVKQTVKSDVKPLQSGVKSDFTPRQRDLLNLLSGLDGQPSDTVNKSEIARQLKVSRPTINKEFEILQSSGKLSLNGHVEVRK